MSHWDAPNLRLHVVGDKGRVLDNFGHLCECLATVVRRVSRDSRETFVRKSHDSRKTFVRVT